MKVDTSTHTLNNQENAGMTVTLTYDHTTLQRKLALILKIYTMCISQPNKVLITAHIGVYTYFCILHFLLSLLVHAEGMTATLSVKKTFH